MSTIESNTTQFQFPGLLIWVMVITCISTCLPLDTALGQDTYTLDQGQWEQTSDQPAPESPKGKLHAIRRAQAEEKYEHALELVDAWIEQHSDHPLAIDAYLLRAEIKVAMQWYFKALYDYETVIREYPASDRYQLALEREFEIAKLFASGFKRLFLGMRILSAASDAEEIFIRIQERAPGSELGEKASWALGNYYYDRSQMTRAVEAYDLFIANYPKSSHRETAMMRLIEASLATFRGPRFDPTGLIEAEQRIKIFQQQYPAAAQRMDAESLLIRIDELLALKMIHTAEWYEQKNQNVSAIVTYRRAIHDYPHTSAGQTAIKRLSALGAGIAEHHQKQPPDQQHMPAQTKD